MTTRTDSQGSPHSSAGKVYYYSGNFPEVSSRHCCQNAGDTGETKPERRNRVQTLMKSLARPIIVMTEESGCGGARAETWIPALGTTMRGVCVESRRCETDVSWVLLLLVLVLLTTELPALFYDTLATNIGFRQGCRKPVLGIWFHDCGLHSDFVLRDFKQNAVL